MINALLSLAALGGAILTLLGLGRAMIRTLRRMGRMADEVLGDGTEEHPGWGKRIATLEAKDGAVAAEVKPNGGASLKDQITRIEQATGATKEETP